jgi:hypothetical protein
MDIRRIASKPSSKGPTEYFTGTVRILCSRHLIPQACFVPVSHSNLVRERHGTHIAKTTTLLA